MNTGDEPKLLLPRIVASYYPAAKALRGFTTIPEYQPSKRIESQECERHNCYPVVPTIQSKYFEGSKLKLRIRPNFGNSPVPNP